MFTSCHLLRTRTYAMQGCCLPVLTPCNDVACVLMPCNNVAYMYLRHAMMLLVYLCHAIMLLTYTYAMQ